MKSHIFRRTTTAPFSPPTQFLILSSLFLLISINHPISTAAADGSPSAYDELLAYDFLVGLLPVGVTGYELNKDTGDINFSCGPSSLLVWFNIVEVSRRGDDIDFSVGIMSAGFGVDNFVESPQCGCGFDCKNKNMMFLEDVLLMSSS